MIRRAIQAVLVTALGLITVAVGSGAAAAAPPPAEVTTLAAPAETKKPPRPKLRAGINERQLKNAMAIVKTGQELGLPRRAFVVALATAMQESRLEVLANVSVPHSFDYQPRDGYGADHDSVGLFQQRVQYHCVNDVRYCMDPRYSAMKFYQELQRVSGWEELPVTVAAQRVQRSAFPDYYAKHQGAAELIVDSILEWQRR